MTQQEIKHTHQKKKKTKKQKNQKQTKNQTEPKQNFGIQGTLAHFNMNSSYEKYKVTQP